MKKNVSGKELRVAQMGVLFWISKQKRQQNHPWKLLMITALNVAVPLRNCPQARPASYSAHGRLTLKIVA